jgi:hypothetical protein
MLSAQVTYDKLIDAYHVKFILPKYDKQAWATLEAVIGIFKSSISVSNREYNPETKEWTFVSTVFSQTVEKIFVTLKLDYTVTETSNTVGPENFFYEHAVNQPIVESGNVISAKLIKLLDITEETLKDSAALKKVYRAKAREFHPDLGGDATKMSELNRLWTLFNDTGVSQ